MARKKTRRRRRYYPRRRRKQSKKIPLAPTAGLLSIFAMGAPSGRTMVQDIMNLDIDAFLYDARERFTGVDQDGKWRPEWMIQTYMPLLAGVVIHKVAGALGVNRYFNKIPVIGKYLAI